jgi:hypothetical protein
MTSNLWSVMNVLVGLTTTIYFYPDKWYFIVAAAVCYLTNAILQGLYLSWFKKAIAFLIFFTVGSGLAFFWLNEITDSETPSSFKLCYVFCILWINTGMIYVSIIRSMLFEYLFLIQRHMTKKEVNERKKTMSLEQLANDKVKGTSPSYFVTFKRFRKFFFSCRIPNSNLWKLNE